ALHEYTRLFDPAPPFGMERTPPCFFAAQLRNYAPALKDLIMFSGTCATGVGVVAKFTEERKQVPGNVFFTAFFNDDTRRAELPMATDYTETSPIGMALDLSAKDNVRRPVGGEEIEESPG